MYHGCYLHTDMRELLERIQNETKDEEKKLRIPGPITATVSLPKILKYMKPR